MVVVDDNLPASVRILQRSRADGIRYVTHACVSMAYTGYVSVIRVYGHIGYNALDRYQIQRSTHTQRERKELVP